MSMRMMLAIAAATCAACTVSAQPRGDEGSVYVDNVVVLLDASGSMNDVMRRTGVRKIDAAKSAIKEILRQVPASTHIGLLVFTSRGARDWVYPLGPRDDERLAQALDPIRPDGGTPLGKYIKIGADRLLEQRAAQFGYGTYRLLIVTDGEANKNDAPLVDRYTPELVARGITVDVIGVDMQRDHTLAKLAHSYRRADDAQSLKTAIAEVFAEVGGGSDDADAEEAFELLAPIPDELAMAMLGALARSGNEPIGSKPGRSARPRASSGGASTPTPGSPRSTPAPPSPPPENGTGSWLLTGVIILGVVVALSVWKKRH